MLCPNWVKWTLIVVQLVGVGWTMARVGQSRDPVDSTDVLAVLIVSPLVIWALWP